MFSLSGTVDVEQPHNRDGQAVDPRIKLARLLGQGLAQRIGIVGGERVVLPDRLLPRRAVEVAADMGQRDPSGAAEFEHIQRATRINTVELARVLPALRYESTRGEMENVV